MLLLDDIAALAKDPALLRGAVATVITTGSLGVDLDIGGTTVPDVPCAATYSSRNAGDVVFVVKIGTGWLVLAKFGAPSTGGPNLLPNPNMESGTLGSLPDQWTTFWKSGAAGNGVLQTSVVHGGSRAVSITVTASGSASAWSLQPTSPVPVASGTQYRVGYWVKSSRALASGETWGASMLSAPTPEGADYFGTGLSTDLLITTKPTTTWAYHEALWTPGTGEDFTRLTLRLDATSTASALTVYVDDLTLRTV